VLNAVCGIVGIRDSRSVEWIVKHLAAGVGTDAIGDHVSSKGKNLHAMFSPATLQDESAISCTLHLGKKLSQQKIRGLNAKRENFVTPSFSIVSSPHFNLPVTGL